MRIFDLLSLFCFCIEIILKWIDDFNGYWKDGWNIMDFVITLLSALPEITDAIGNLGTSMNLGVVGSELRTFRVLRTLKMIVRFGSLKIIILTILQSLQSVAFVMLMILLVAYVYGIMAVNFYEGYTKSTRTDLKYQYAFANLGNSMMTLFQLLTLDQWDGMNRDISKVADPVVSNVFIISWVWLGAFIFRNVFVGVMVNNFDQISDTLKEQKAEYTKQRKFEKLRKKLNKELAVQGNLQGNIQKSLTNLRASNAGAPPAQPTSGTEQPQPTELSNNMICASKFAGKPEQQNDVLETIQRLLIASRDISKGWEATVTETLASLAAHESETMWPRDTLFKYLQLMENLQENMKEYQELQLLAGEGDIFS
ncbi:Cation channel sperm-associated protein 2 [Quaeritorhiza haematococci]|nr:Cation channel sperm-associated protein 2 [Quaeritorhiza haematococci]